MRRLPVCDRSQEQSHAGPDGDTLAGVAAVVVSNDSTCDSTEDCSAGGSGTEKLGV